MSVCRCAIDLLSVQDKLGEAKAVTKIKPFVSAEASLQVGNTIVALNLARLSCNVDLKPEISKLHKAEDQIYEKDWDKALRTLESVDKEIYVEMDRCAFEEY